MFVSSVRRSGPAAAMSSRTRPAPVLLRSLLRGTRRARLEPDHRIASLFFDEAGDQRSAAEVAAVLRRALTELPPSRGMQVVAGEYFGLSGFPLDLTGERGLVVRLAATTGSRRDRHVSRSKASALVAETADRLEEQLLERPGHPQQLQPEEEPSGQLWVLAPPAIGRALTQSETARLLAAASECACDLVCRADWAPELFEAIYRWSERHTGQQRPDGAHRVEIRQEHRNAANAMLALSLWEIVHSKEQLDVVLADGPALGWFGLLPEGTGGRYAEHSKWGPMSSALDANEFVLLADDVLERRDEDGRSIDLLMDLLRAGRHQDLLSVDARETVLWALGYGLAAQGSWRVVEFARWYAVHEPRSLTTASLLSWAAHVASLHHHDGMAWRLCGSAERVLSSLSDVPEGKLSGLRWQISLVRSGCRVREADALAAGKQLSNATTALSESVLQLRMAETASQHFNASTSLSKRVTNDLRRAEILLVAARLRSAGRPLAGLSDELRQATQIVQTAEAIVSRAADAEFDDGDRAIFEARVDALKAALHALVRGLDDSPLTLMT